MTVYEIITSRIVEMLQQGTVPWRKPWSTDVGEPRNLISGKPYRGINVFLLSAMGCASPYWLTHQGKPPGGSLRLVPRVLGEASGAHVVPGVPDLQGADKVPHLGTCPWTKLDLIVVDYTSARSAPSITVS